MKYRSIDGLLLFVVFISLAIGASAQKKDEKDKKSDLSGSPVMWQPVSIPDQDLLAGPGGDAMKPDLSSVTFVSDKPGGHSIKYDIKDGAGRKWVAKIGDEAQSETAAVRLLAAIGYKTEINYLVPTLTIPGKGTFNNVRLEARPDGVKRCDRWRWGQTPLGCSPERESLKILMA